MTTATEAICALWLEGIPLDDVVQAHEILRVMEPVSIVDLDMRFDEATFMSGYWVTDNSDLAAILDGDAEEWNRTAAQVQAWR